jgi:hypothetical protein
MAKTGNAASSTVSVASVAPPGVNKAACKKLDEKNKKERAKLVRKLDNKSSLTQAEQTTLDKARGGGMTISSVKSTVPGTAQISSASSSGVAQSSIPSSFVEGGSSEQKCGCNSDVRNKKRRSKAEQQQMDDAGTLCDEEYVHPGGGKGAHAEAKIANQMSESSSMKGGSMLLSIDWRFNRSGKVKRSGMPCGSCYKMLCHAATECDIKIFICDKDNKPQPLSKKDCKDEDGYKNLSKRVDGNIRPGR